MKKLAILTLMTFVSLMVLTRFSFATVNSSMKEGVNEAIQVCEAKYLDAKAWGAKIDGISVPTLLTLDGNAKKASANKEKYQKVFATKMQEFTKFTETKGSLVNAVPDIIFQPDNALSAQVTAYSDECAQRAEKIKKFGSWAVSGEFINKDNAILFQSWINQVS